MAAHTRWVQMESMSEAQEHFPGAQWAGRTDGSLPHTCTFYIKNPRQAEFQQLAEQIATPGSAMYGKHLTKEQVDDMTRNDAGMAIVDDYLRSVGAVVGKRTSSSIEATAPISVWEAALHTEFRDVTVPASTHTLHRATAFSLPEGVAEHVNMVQNTVQLPAQMRPGPIIMHHH